MFDDWLSQTGFGAALACVGGSVLIPIDGYKTQRGVINHKSVYLGFVISC